MTLALHGKSKRRQMGLLTAALMAVVLAAVGGVMWMGISQAANSDPCLTTPCGPAPTGSQKAVPLKAAHQNTAFGSATADNTDCGGLTGYVWHFTFVPANSNDAVSFTARFLSAGDVTGTSTDGKHVFVSTPTADTLRDGSGLAASTTGYTEVNLSHVCHVGADPSVTVNKTNSTANNLVTAGGTFDWIITLTVANGPTTSAYSFTDSAPAGMTFGTNSVTSEAEAGKLTCLSGAGSPVSCTLASGADTGNYVLTIHVTAPSSTEAANVCKGYANSVKTAQGTTLDTDTVNVTGCSNTATITVKKVVSGSGSSADDQFGGTVNSQVSGTVHTFTDLSQNGPKPYTDVAPGTYYAQETNANGYTPLGYSVGDAEGNCPGPTSTTATAVTVTVAAGDSKVLCIYNQKDALVLLGSVVVKKDYVLNGGTKVVPVVHVEDLNDPTPAIDGNGLNDATHSQWEPVPVDTSGLVSVWEDLPAGWTTSGPPTISGCQIPDHSFLVQASENLVFVPPADANTAVQVLVDPEGICTVTFHNEQIAQTRTIRIGKVTTTATHPQEFFTGTIAPGTPGTFSVNLPANQSAGPITDYVMANQNGQVVTETNVPANWTVNGYTVKADADGKGSCSTTESYSGTSANVPSGSGTYLVCIRNTYTPPPTTTPTPFNPCAFGCAPLILNTPTPTVVPPTPTVVPPTPTVAPPTATPTKAPVEEVEGAKTPGAIATPLAPSTGSGLGDGGSSTNLFIALIGIFSLSGGLALLGYGRKRR